MSHTAIPDDELKVFDSLENIEVVFDVGARDDVDYLILKPNIQLHCFEPNPVFFEELKAQIGDKPNVFLNNYGIGSEEGTFKYASSSETFQHSSGDQELPVKTLDGYIRDNNITKIDFLKTDAEGWDYKILSSSPETIKITRYVQYEHWDDDGKFHELLSKDFDIDYIGGRNSICTRKGEKKPWIPEQPQEGGLTGKTEKNQLK